MTSTDEDRIAEAMRLADQYAAAYRWSIRPAIDEERAALEAHLRAALAPSMQDAEDAARYRWLRDQMWAQALNTIYALPICWGVDYPGQAGESMDAAIDAARAPQEGSQP